MRKKFGTVTLTAGIAAGALAGIAVGGPLLANAAGTQSSTTTAATSTTSPGTGQPTTGDGQSTAGDQDRQARLREALTPLVDDGTLTQAQADAVVKRLAEAMPGRDGHGRHGVRGAEGMHGMHGMHGPMREGLDAAAKALKMTRADLVKELAAGRSVAEVAKAKAVATSTVVDAVVAQAGKELDQAVKDGRLTKQEADAIRPGLKERITRWIEKAPPRFADDTAPNGSSGTSGSGSSSG